MEEADGFAQVFPEHKFTIVKALQQRGHIAGMTGDGVNDAPALGQANAGIAVSGATDAARAAAALVLTAPGISVIVRAVEEARKIFERMTSYAIYRITETIRIMFFVVLTMVAFNFYPITTVMIILLALLNDLPIMTIAYDNTLLEQKPVRWAMRRVLTVATTLGLIGVAETFGLLLIARLLLDLTVPQDPIVDLSETRRRGPPHPVCRQDEASFLHKALSRPRPSDRGCRDADHRCSHCGFRLPRRRYPVEIRRLGLGLLPCMDIHRGPGEAPRLPPPSS